MTELTREGFEREVLRLNARYNAEVVEALNLCPYARGARTTGRSEKRVVLSPRAEPGPLLAVIDAVEAGDPALEVVQVIFPLVGLGPLAWDRFVARVRDEDRARRDVATLPQFVSAAFHPGYARRDDTPEQLVPFLRRSPDPMVQLVRYSVLDAVRGPSSNQTILFDFSEAAWAALAKRNQAKNTSARIAADNHATYQKHGREAFESLFAELRADRARAYAPYFAAGVVPEPQPEDEASAAASPGVPASELLTSAAQRKPETG